MDQWGRVPGQHVRQPGDAAKEIAGEIWGGGGGLGDVSAGTDVDDENGEVSDEEVWSGVW